MSLAVQLAFTVCFSLFSFLPFLCPFFLSLASFPFFLSFLSAILLGISWYLTVDLIFISLIKHLLICLFAMPTHECFIHINLGFDRSWLQSLGKLKLVETLVQVRNQAQELVDSALEVTQGRYARETIGNVSKSWNPASQAGSPWIGPEMGTHRQVANYRTSPSWGSRRKPDKGREGRQDRSVSQALLRAPGVVILAPDSPSLAPLL